MQGAWRPALNISTVLASIGLLLADPNPEDGLMTEVVSPANEGGDDLDDTYVMHKAAHRCIATPAIQSKCNVGRAHKYAVVHAGCRVQAQ